MPLRKNTIEKLEYRCTTRNLSLCNGTIIVLKITLLHSVSVITNFVIPKRDKKNKNELEINMHHLIIIIIIIGVLITRT